MHAVFDIYLVITDRGPDSQTLSYDLYSSSLKITVMMSLSYGMS